MPRPVLALLVLSLALSGCREDKEVAMHEPPRDRSFAKTSAHALETFGNVTVLAKDGKTAEGAIATRRPTRGSSSPRESTRARGWTSSSRATAGIRGGTRNRCRSPFPGGS